MNISWIRIPLQPKFILMNQKNPPFHSKPRSREDYRPNRRNAPPREGEERRGHSGRRSERPFHPPFPKHDGERENRPFRYPPKRQEEGDGNSRPRRFFQKREGNFSERPRRYHAPNQDEQSKLKLRPRKKKVIKEEAPVVRERRLPVFEKEEMRLNKFISNSGICSRREADTFIAAGLVTVNGEVVTTMGARVKPTDDVRFNGERLMGEERVYIVMNKPKDVVTTTDDPHAEQTVIDLLTGKCPQRVYPVGRLDKSTTGVLLLTNDGALTEQLTHPSYNRKKIYQVDLDKNFKKSDMELLIKGIVLEDGPAHVDEISYVDENEKKIGVEIHSGRNRILRRMFEHLGYSIKKLDRVYFAGLTKKKLRRGAWRFLTPKEVAILKMGSYE